MGKLEFATHVGIMVATSVINKKTCLLIKIEIDFVHYSMVPTCKFIRQPRIARLWAET